MAEKAASTVLDVPVSLCVVQEHVGLFANVYLNDLASPRKMCIDN